MATTRRPAISFDGFKDEDIISKEQLAECLQCSARTIETKTHQVGGIPSIDDGGRRLYIVGSVRKWLRDREVNPGGRVRKRAA